MNTSGRAALSIAAVALIGLTGCSATTATEESDAVTESSALFNEEAAALVPASIAEAGVLQMVTTVGMAPLNYPDEAGDLQGFNIDLMSDLGEVLGLGIEVHGASMDQIIPGIQSGRYDITASNMAITEERALVLDFVQYYFANSSLATLKGNPDQVSPDALCGMSVGVSNGSFQQTVVMPEKMEACAAAGSEPIDVQSYADQQKAVLALDSGRLQAVAGDTPILLYAASKNDRIEVGEKLTNGSILGIGMNEGSELVEPIAAAMEYLISSGAYEKTLDRYGLSDLAIETAEIKK
ncbi:ABC transporter substrate-binding protein [Cryobacterium sp. PH29-G1]|uniref:ABC transporter substrate-binding protein n=1 Tax=Cryobacterium sp. PH29-G1 TaxID=3046211 RepID=UPI0024BA6E0D|nr:ABC transporter substrate-binding protein [Cryobacterium sp. PH29-G1]MDJ0348850.1 ABC transporter substrate-binding protein [Cryobacterium sp. PH29-G1]